MSQSVPHHYCDSSPYEPSVKKITTGSLNDLYPVFKYRHGSAYSIVSFPSSYMGNQCMPLKY